MTVDADLWKAYQRLQEQLDAAPRVNNRTWAIEVALDGILASMADGNAHAAGKLETQVSSAERRERHRQALRARFLHPATTLRIDLDEVVDARLAFRKLWRGTRKKDRPLLQAIAQEFEPSEIAARTDIKPAAVRVRIFRLRAKLKKLAA